MKVLFFNNLRLFFKDKKAVILTFLLPIGLVTLFMFIFGGTSSNDDRGMSALELGYCDLVKSKETKDLITELDTSQSYNMTEIKDSATLYDDVNKGNLKGGILIQKIKNNGVGYTLILDGAREVENSMLKPMLGFKLMGIGSGNAKMKDLIFKKIKEDYPDFNDSDRVKLDKNFDSFDSGTFEKLSQENVKTVTLKPDSGVNPGAIQAISGNALMTLLFAVAGMGAGIIEEKERGTLRRILVSPIRPMDFMFAKFFASIVIAIMQLGVTLLYCNVVFAFPVFMNPLEITLLILSTSMAAASFGILLASIAETRKQIESMSTIVVLLMSLLGGSMIPSFVMPPMMQNFSMFTINYWAGEGFFDIYYRNVEFSHFIIKVLILLGFCTVLLSLSTWLFRRKLAKMF